MDNFNLRYECSDARDDFVAQRKLIEKNGKGPAHMPFNNEELNDIDKDNVEEDAMDEVNKYDHPDQEQECQEPFAVIGETAAKHLMQMNTVENLLHEIGWTKTKPITNPTPSNLDHIDHSLNWNSVLDDKKKEILALRADTCTSNPMPTTITPLSPTSLAYIKAFLNQLKNLVRWKTLDYLLQTYSKDEREIIELKSSITSTYSLNKEQERAFKIITNHATCNTTERLQMYLGGMAGTGKSQVLKAVTKFFEDIGQSGQIVLLAPTGSAAAQIGGSTYHSYLGFNDKNTQQSSTSTIARLHQKLEKVKYIFIDEVSMISCHDLYKISARLAQITNENEKPFGGMNLIFAGDFAQLPPVGKCIYLYGRVNDSSSIIGQKNAIGKALWHQTTTVVILRENMRQTSQTKDDAKFRTALENMRYRNCTTDDIEYLHGLASLSSVKQKLDDDRFRNVSVITALNVHRDRINELGSKRYASDTGQKLQLFPF